MPSHLTKPVRIFCSYAHEDEWLRQELEAHLAPLTDGGRVESWHDRMIEPGETWQDRIDEHLEAADIILFLVSSDFLKSDYCRRNELPRALQLQEAGRARVIPVILRPCLWSDTDLGRLQALPEGGHPVVLWPSRDEAFTDVVMRLRSVIDELPPSSPPPTAEAGPARTQTTRFPSIPRPPKVGFVSRKDFHGRDIVEVLKAELAPRGSRLITLSGLGGVGKTKLAAEVVRALEADYEGRIVWGDATERTYYTLQSLLDDVATQLGRPDLSWARAGGDEGMSEEREARVRQLAAEAPTLVVLDTSERIAPEDHLDIEGFLERSRCAALFVSLNRNDNMHPVTVLPMTRDESEELILRLVDGTQDPQIFTDEVRARIHKTTEGRPFLIEWVVAQIDSGPQPPDKVLDELERGKGDAADRIFNRFFTLPYLGDDGRTVLFALSLFRPSATRKALAAVAGLPEGSRLDEAVRNLRKLSLLKTDGPQFRLRLHGLTLTLAEARLPNDLWAPVYRRRFVAYFRDFAMGDDWPPCEDLAAPEVERSNILMAMQLAPLVEDWDTALELFNRTLGLINSFKVFREAVKLAEEEEEERLSADAGRPLPILIEIYHREKDTARRCYQELLQRLDPWKIVGLSVAHFELGVFAHADGDNESALKHLREAERLKIKFEDWRGVAITRNNLGVVMAEEDRGCAEAGALFHEALDYFVGEGSRFAEVVRRNLKWREETRRGD